MTEIKEDVKKNGTKGGSIRIIMIVSYVLITLISVCSVAVLTYSKTSNTMTDKVGKLTMAINDQVRLGMNNHIHNIEDICSLIFADSTICDYYDSDEAIADYDKIQIKSEIENLLLTNSLMNNFGDFCIVYDNNKSVGKLSSTTSGLFGSDTMYTKAESFITRSTTMDGWVAGVDEYYTRIFYVKRVNEHAVLLASIYAEDLIDLMEISEELDGMEINILNESDKVIFSTGKYEAGEKFDSDFADELTGRIRSTFILGDNLVTVNAVNENWRIVSNIATENILREVFAIRDYTVIIAVICVLVSIAIGMYFTGVITKPIRKIIAVMKKAETGDLTAKADFNAIGDLNQLKTSYNGMLEQISELIRNTDMVSDKVEKEVSNINEIARTSQNISENISIAIEDIARGSTKQYDHSQTSFESLEKLADNIATATEYVRDVGESSKMTRKIGRESIEQIADLSEKNRASTEALHKIEKTFAKLAEEVNSIEEVLSLILSISDETSLLALNASIEAARAGEAGKGFAVVADEVSKLALQTEESTNGIGVVIGKIREHVQLTMDMLKESVVVFEEQAQMVEQMIESFEGIVESTNEITGKLDNVERITRDMNDLKDESISATRDILEVAENASANTQEVASVTIEELEVSKELASKADELSRQVSELRESLKQFIIKEKERGN